MSVITSSEAGSSGTETEGLSRSVGTKASKSTINNRVSFGPIDPDPDPDDPYAFPGGIVSSLELLFQLQAQN